MLNQRLFFCKHKWVGHFHFSPLICKFHFRISYCTFDFYFWIILFCFQFSYCYFSYFSGAIYSTKWQCFWHYFPGFLPSSFSMYAMSLSSGLFLLDKPAMTVTVAAVGVILGWPFSILAFLPVTFYSLARRFKQAFLAGAVTSVALLVSQWLAHFCWMYKVHACTCIIVTQSFKCLILSFLFFI